MDMNLSKLQEIVKDMEPWCAAVHKIAKTQTGLSTGFTNSKIAIKYPSLEPGTSHFSRQLQEGTKGLFLRFLWDAYFGEFAVLGSADDQGIASSVSLLILIYYWGEKLFVFTVLSAEEGAL